MYNWWRGPSDVEFWFRQKVQCFQTTPTPQRSSTLPSLKFNIPPWKVTFFNGKIVFQPSFFRGELLNFVGVMICGCTKIPMRCVHIASSNTSVLAWMILSEHSGNFHGFWRQSWRFFVQLNLLFQIRGGFWSFHLLIFQGIQHRQAIPFDRITMVKVHSLDFGIETSKQIHPWKLTWHWQIPIFNRKYIFKWWVFYCHVSFRGGGGMYNEFPVNGVDDGLCVCVCLSQHVQIHICTYTFL